MSKITYLTGNLLSATQRVIAHGCNARGTMGKGLAKDLKAAYPDAFEVYRNKFERDGLNVGEVIPWVSERRVVLNLITQDGYGKAEGVVYTNYDGVRACMRRIETAARRHQSTGEGAFHTDPQVAFPRIGAGYGKGDWDKIAEIIEGEINSLEIYVYTPAAR